MKRISLLAALLLLILTCTAPAGERYPGKTWLMYENPEEAGFSAAMLEEARDYWETLDSAAFMAVYDGAVLVAWGDVDRRFMCHSVRKSLMSGLYGIHVDQGRILTSMTMEMLDIDDDPPLTAEEKQATIMDLLKARSGVFRLAAYEPPQNPKPPRGSHEPGAFWCYNNWDFNTLLTILEQEAGVKVFEDFKKSFADPLEMEDYRVRDGYYHYEREKSIHPAYPFRMSARDMARFGLLYLRKGKWKDKRILSEEWIRESTRSHSETGGPSNYGYLWWISQIEPFKELGMFSALGVGKQSIDVVPGADLLAVMRTNTFDHCQVSKRQRLELLKRILDARKGEVSNRPKLVLLPRIERSFKTVSLTDRQKKTFISVPTDSSSDRIILEGGSLVLQLTHGEQYEILPLDGGRFILEDSFKELFLEKNSDGSLARVITEFGLNVEGYRLLNSGATDRAVAVFQKAVKYYPESPNAYDSLAEAYMAKGDRESAIENYEKSLKLNPRNTDAVVGLRRLRFEMPDTPSGKCMASYIEAFNSSGDKLMGKFIERYYAGTKLSLKHRLKEYHDLLDEWGKLEPLSVAMNNEFKIILLLRETKTGAGWAFRFELEKDPPHYLSFSSMSGPLPPFMEDDKVVEVAED